MNSSGVLVLRRTTKRLHNVDERTLKATLPCSFPTCKRAACGRTKRSRLHALGDDEGRGRDAVQLATAHMTEEMITIQCLVLQTNHEAVSFAFCLRSVFCVCARDYVVWVSFCLVGSERQNRLWCEGSMNDERGMHDEVQSCSQERLWELLSGVDEKS